MVSSRAAFMAEENGQVAKGPDEALIDGIVDARTAPFILAATILASSMAFIDSSIAGIALPAIGLDLGASFQALQWVVNAYTLMLGGLILVGGAVGDRFGRRRIFLVGMVTFAAASLACAMAPTVEALIAARAAKGVGAALLVPQSLAIIAASFPRERRGRAIGIWAAASGITTTIGPPLGGFLLDTLDWRAVFWINLPLAAIAVWLTAHYVPRVLPRKADGPLDWQGACTAILGFGLLTLGLTLMSDPDVPRPAVLWCIAAGVVGVIAFVRIEQKGAAPLVPMALFQSRAFTIANVTTLLLYGAIGAIFFLLPFDLIARRGMSAGEAGLAMLPIGLIIGALARNVGAFADRRGPREPLVLGAVCVTASGLLFAGGFDGVWLGAMPPILALGFGLACIVTPLTTAVMNSAPDVLSGAASGVNNAASRLAGLFSIALLGSIASIVFMGGVETAGLAAEGRRFGLLPDPSDPEFEPLAAAFRDGYAWAMLLAALLSAIAAIVAALFIPGRPATDPETAAAD